MCFLSFSLIKLKPLLILTFLVSKHPSLPKRPAYHPVSSLHLSPSPTVDTAHKKIN